MEDLIIGTGSVVLILALLPSIFSDDKPNITTSLLTATVLFSFAAAYANLDLTFACTTALVTGSLWLTLAYQVFERDRKYGKEIKEEQGTSG